MSASKLCTRYQFASTIFIAVRWLQRVARRMAAMMCLRAVTVTICFPPDLWISSDLGDVWGRLSMRSAGRRKRSEEHTSELQSLMRISYAVFCLKKKKNNQQTNEQ